MQININYNTLIKDNSRNIIKKNISPKNAYNNKMFGNIQMAHSTSKSNITSLNDNQKDKLKRISIPLKASNNNKSRDMILYLNSNEKLNRYKTDAETNNSFKKNIIGNSVNKANDSCYDSEKENYMNNLNFDKCNKKTIEKGGKFNNISTTYVVFSKNSCSNKNLLQPSRTIENRNFSKKIITQNLSTMSLLQNPMNSVNSIIPVGSRCTERVAEGVAVVSAQTYAQAADGIVVHAQRTGIVVGHLELIGARGTVVHEILGREALRVKARQQLHLVSPVFQPSP